MKKVSSAKAFIALILLCTIIDAQTNIAVMNFVGKGVSQHEASALADRLSRELFEIKIFIVLEREMIGQILAEQDFQLTGCTSPDECAVQVGQLINVEYIVAGSVSKVGRTFTVLAKMINVETGEVLRTSAYDHKGDIDDLLVTGMKKVAIEISGRDSEIPKQPKRPSLEGVVLETSRNAIDTRFAYLGVDDCRMCHKQAAKGGQFGRWSETRHSKSFETLQSDEASKIAREKGLQTPPAESGQCLICHTTGWGIDSGFKILSAEFAANEANKKVVRDNTFLANVGCEACHGPGKGYKSKKTMTSIFNGSIDPASVGLFTPSERNMSRLS